MLRLIIFIGVLMQITEANPHCSRYHTCVTEARKDFEQCVGGTAAAIIGDIEDMETTNFLLAQKDQITKCEKQISHDVTDYRLSRQQEDEDILKCTDIFAWHSPFSDVSHIKKVACAGTPTSWDLRYLVGDIIERPSQCRELYDLQMQRCSLLLVCCPVHSLCVASVSLNSTVHNKVLRLSRKIADETKQCLASSFVSENTSEAQKHIDVKSKDSETTHSNDSNKENEIMLESLTVSSDPDDSGKEKTTTESSQHPSETHQLATAEVTEAPKITQQTTAIDDRTESNPNEITPQPSDLKSTEEAHSKPLPETSTVSENLEGIESKARTMEVSEGKAVNESSTDALNKTTDVPRIAVTDSSNVTDASDSDSKETEKASLEPDANTSTISDTSELLSTMTTKVSTIPTETTTHSLNSLPKIEEIVPVNNTASASLMNSNTDSVKKTTPESKMKTLMIPEDFWKKSAEETAQSAITTTDSYESASTDTAISSDPFISDASSSMSQNLLGVGLKPQSMETEKDSDTEEVTKSKNDLENTSQVTIPENEETVGEASTKSLDSESTSSVPIISDTDESMNLQNNLENTSQATSLKSEEATEESMTKLSSAESNLSIPENFNMEESMKMKKDLETTSEAAISENEITEENLSTKILDSESTSSNPVTTSTPTNTETIPNVSNKVKNEDNNNSVTLSTSNEEKITSPNIFAILFPNLSATSNNKVEDTTDSAILMIEKQNNHAEMNLVTMESRDIPESQFSKDDKSSSEKKQLSSEESIVFCEKVLTCEENLRRRELMCQRQYAFPNFIIDSEMELSDLIVQAELMANSALAEATEAVSKACMRPITNVVLQQLSDLISQMESDRKSCTRRTAKIRNVIAFDNKAMCEAITNEVCDENKHVDEALFNNLKTWQNTFDYCAARMEPIRKQCASLRLCCPTYNKCSDLMKQSKASNRYEELMSGVKRIQSECERKIMATLRNLQSGFVPLT